MGAPRSASRRRAGRALFALSLALVAAAAADDVRSVIELQTRQRSEQLELPGGAAGPIALRLVDLNDGFHVWYLLEVGRPGAATRSYHLENPRLRGQLLRLDRGSPAGLRVEDATGSHPCELGLLDPNGPLEQARASGRAFAPLCGDRIFLRNAVTGHRTPRERVTDYLRDNVWNGEKITVFVRSTLYADAYAEKADVALPPPAEPGRGPVAEDGRAPAPADMVPDLEGLFLDGRSLGLSLVGAPQRRLAIGRWYPVVGVPDVFVSAFRAGAVAAGILKKGPGRAQPLDEVERKALVYLIAFDLERFEFGFAVGTDHPRVDWSERVPVQMRDARLPGPDGFGSVAPLVMTGKVSPTNAARTVATITGGFKRSHGAFKHGELSLRNRGTHYGFAEQGVVLSRMQPGLSTFYVLDDGSVHLETWTEAHAPLVPRLLFARQNGVALVEPDPETGEPVPGSLVSRWGAGNWSGSQDSHLRALRSGLCLQESPAGRYLVYGYFSTATPSAMARVFQAYGCRYAMHLDMNALEHTYMAVYLRQGRQVSVQHLVDEMKVLDVDSGGEPVARFLGYPDNRDFFYVMRRPAGDE